MFINSLIPNFNSKYTKQQQITPIKPILGFSFRGSVKNIGNIKFSVSEILDKFKNYTTVEYKTLSNDELEFLRKKYSEIVINKTKDEKIHDFVSEYIKNYLNNIYGEGKYVVIIIGRSLSSIGKVLGYKIGEENVKNIPLSEAWKYSSTKITNKEKRIGGIDILRNFLETLGLSKKTIKESDKKYVIMDYCITGDSLKGAKHLLSRNDLLGRKNIIELDVANCINDRLDKLILRRHLFIGSYKNISYVSSADSLSNIPGAVVNTKLDDIDTNLFRFKLLDNFMQKLSTNQDK